MKSNKTFQRGFTLIELMIVIVILGILMGTILPRLTGAQGRARDTARMADLTNIAQSLEVYYNDNGAYPPGTGCLSQDAENPTGQDLDNLVDEAGKLASYLKGGKIIKPGTTSMNSNGCIGSYYYSALEKDGVPGAAYVLVSDVETFQTANWNLETPITSTTAYSVVAGTSKLASEAAVATNSVYVLIP